MCIDIYSQIYSICLDNKCYNYIYYVFVHVFIEIFVFLGVNCGLCLYCIATVFIGLIFIADSYLLNWI